MPKLAAILFNVYFATLISSQQRSAPALLNSVTSTKKSNSELSPADGNRSHDISGSSPCTCVPNFPCHDERLIDSRVGEKPCREICCNKAKRSLPESSPNKTVECGYNRPDLIDFTSSAFDSNESLYGEFPWMVAVLKQETYHGSSQILNIYRCGGALIHSRVVLTAAQCVNAKNETFKIRAGEWDTQTKNEFYPHQDRKVQKVITHQNYSSGDQYNDIALLLLESPVTIAENVKVVCLPHQDANYDNTRCFASGWGKDVSGKLGRYQTILKKLDLPIAAREKCSEELRKTHLGNSFQLHSSFICAGGKESREACKGDEGSPLVCPIPGQRERYAQVGIVSWRINCGYTKTPGVYVNVAKFRNWIDSQMSLLDIRERHYAYED